MKTDKTGIWNWLVKISNYAFICVIVLITLVGLVKTVCLPDEISEYENRYAETVDELSFTGYLDGTFQESMDDALGDQVTMASTFKVLYNKINTSIQNVTSKFLLTKTDYFKNRYSSLNGTLIFNGDTLVFATYPDYKADYLYPKIDDYNSTFAAFPDVEFFIYYIEKDTDINFETNEKKDFFGIIRDNLNLPDENMACFEVNSFEDFSRNFYKTDHHWNYVGSYKGYCEVMKLLRCEEALLEPIETVTMQDVFSGSKATSSGAMYSEAFTAYRFDFPPMEIMLNGERVADYGEQPGYLSGELGTPAYGKFYGGDGGEIIFDTSRTEQDDILIIGESYDNAILKLVASHHNRTYSIDLRNYEARMGEKFVLSEYLQEHDISKVLLIGNVDYYLMDEFMIGE